MVTVSEELNPLERGSGLADVLIEQGTAACALETHASNLEGCPRRHHPRLVRFYSDLDNPKKKPRRGPYCGAPTPTPVPLRI
jgi:hypothetical protein